jgi:hypothetical protein
VPAARRARRPSPFPTAAPAPAATLGPSHGAARSPPPSLVVPVLARGPVPACSPPPARLPLPTCPRRRRGPATCPSRRVPGAACPWRGAVGPRHSPAACAARLASARPRWLLTSLARCLCGLTLVCERFVHGASVWPCACSRGARGVLARLAVPSTRSASPRSRRARLPQATRLPLTVYFMRINHIVYINEIETQFGN